MMAIPVPNQVSPGQRNPALDRLRARPLLVFGGVAVALLLAAGTVGRPWLEALGVGSAVLSLLPCAAMCAAGLCMRGGGGCAKQDGADGSAGTNMPSVPHPSTSI